MNQIIIGFSSSTKILPLYSWAIKLCLGIPYSHVYVKTITRYQIPLIYQAQGTQVNFMNQAAFDLIEKTYKEFTFSASDEAYDKYMRFALENVGKPYSALTVLGDVLVLIFGLTKNPFANDRKGFVCSELVGDILSEIALKKLDQGVIDIMTPRDVFEICEKLAG